MELANFRITHKGKFNYAAIRKAISSTFKKHGVFNTVLLDADKGDEYEFDWMGDRKPDGFYNWKYKVTLKGININKKTSSGSLTIIIKAEMVMDHQKKFEGSAVKQKLKNLFANFLNKKHTDEMAVGCITIAEEIRENITQVLDNG